MEEPQNLMDGLLSEMNRVREIKIVYDQILAENFGSKILQASIDAAELSIKENDIEKMISAYKNLKQLR